MKEKPIFGIAVDGYCKGNPGPGGYRIVDIQTGEIIKEWHSGYNLTNNIAEFIGLVHALGLVKKGIISGTVYSDSEIAIAWVKSKSATTRFETGSNPSLAKRIWKCEMFLTEQKREPVYKKWDTKNWGEIPADFGNKK
jgi:ribonuclease HI